MGAKYSYGVWEQFADQASTILVQRSLFFFLGVYTLAGHRDCGGRGPYIGGMITMP